MDDLNIQWNPEWDKTNAAFTDVAEFEGGKLYKMSPCHLLVLNGTHRQMGRQYGHLLKDQIHYMRDQLAREFIKTPAGLNPANQQTGLMTYEEMRDFAATGFYKAKPRHHKEMLEGAAETSGLSLEEHAILDEMMHVVMWGRSVNMCSSLACWGEHSRDGALYTGRNHDFSMSWRDNLEAAGVWVVMNPAGASLSHSFAARAGQINFSVDAMNSAGLYIECNNAWNVISYVYSKERSIGNWVVQLIEDYTSVDELDYVMPNISSSAGLNIMGADPTQARYYEVSHFKTVKTEPEFGTMTSRSNLALHDEWQLPDAYPTRTAEYSKPRRENFVAYFQKDPKTNDDAKHRAYLSKELFQNRELQDGSAFFLNNTLGLDSWTAYQVATKPAERKVWWRIPTRGPWQEIDLRKYFTNT